MPQPRSPRSGPLPLLALSTRAKDTEFNYTRYFHPKSAKYGGKGHSQPNADTIADEETITTLREQLVKFDQKVKIIEELWPNIAITQLYVTELLQYMTELQQYIEAKHQDYENFNRDLAHARGEVRSLPMDILVNVDRLVKEQEKRLHAIEEKLNASDSDAGGNSVADGAVKNELREEVDKLQLQLEGLFSKQDSGGEGVLKGGGAIKHETLELNPAFLQMANFAIGWRKKFTASVLELDEPLFQMHKGEDGKEKQILMKWRDAVNKTEASIVAETFEDNHWNMFTVFLYDLLQQFQNYDETHESVRILVITTAFWRSFFKSEQTETEDEMTERVREEVKANNRQELIRLLQEDIKNQVFKTHEF